MMDLIITGLMVFFGFSIGATMPDIDLAPPLPIRHRSLWTHGPTYALIALWIAALYPQTWPFWAAFLPGLIIHLVKDMFPKHWAGGALIKFYPFKGNFGPSASFVFLGLGVISAAWVFTTLPVWGVIDKLLAFVGGILVGFGV